MDRGSKYTAQFRRIIHDAGVKPLSSPTWSLSAGQDVWPMPKGEAVMTGGFDGQQPGEFYFDVEGTLHPRGK